MVYLNTKYKLRIYSVILGFQLPVYTYIPISTHTKMCSTIDGLYSFIYIYFFFFAFPMFHFSIISFFKYFLKSKLRWQLQNIKENYNLLCE